MTNGSGTSPWPSNVSDIYQEAATQLRFMKRQQWAITNYLLALLVGILAVYGDCWEIVVERHRVDNLMPGFIVLRFVFPKRGFLNPVQFRYHRVSRFRCTVW